MYDASSAAAPAKPFPLTLVVGYSLVATLVVVLTMTGAMLIPDNPVLPAIGAVLALGAAIAFASHFGGLTVDAILMVAICGFMGYASVSISSHMRGDHEINANSYSWIARTLRARPELTPLIAAARADRVVTNGEKDRFEADIEAFDRRQVLAD